jgi:hypothetical protein
MADPTGRETFAEGDDLDVRLAIAFTTAGDTLPMSERAATNPEAIHGLVRRRARRRIGAAVLAAAMAAAAVTAVTFVAVDRRSSTARIPVAAVGPAHVAEGAAHTNTLRHLPAAPTTVIDLPGAGPDVWALGNAGGQIWLARGERNKTGEGHLPTTIIGIDAQTGVVDRRGSIDGEALSATEFDGFAWVLSRDRVVTGPTDPTYRLKRVDAKTGAKLASFPLPADAVIAGPIAAGAGHIWIPTKTGVLGVDPATGKVVATTALDVTDAAQRGVAVLGANVWATDGAKLWRLDATGVRDAKPLAAPAGLTYTGLHATKAALWAVATADDLAVPADLVNISTDGSTATRTATTPATVHAAWTINGDEADVWLSAAQASGSETLLTVVSPSRIVSTLVDSERAAVADVSGNALFAAAPPTLLQVVIAAP